MKIKSKNIVRALLSVSSLAAGLTGLFSSESAEAFSARCGWTCKNAFGGWENISVNCPSNRQTASCWSNNNFEIRPIWEQPHYSFGCYTNFIKRPEVPRLVWCSNDLS